MHACPCHLVREQEWRIRDAPGEALLSPDFLWPPPAGRRSVRSLEGKGPSVAARRVRRTPAPSRGYRPTRSFRRARRAERQARRGFQFAASANRVFPCAAEGRLAEGERETGRAPHSPLAAVPRPLSHRALRSAPRPQSDAANWSGADRSRPPCPGRPRARSGEARRPAGEVGLPAGGSRGVWFRWRCRGRWGRRALL